MRSQKARISVRFYKNRLMILSLLMGLLLIIGIILIIIGSSIGWAFIGLSSIPAMIVQWYNGELRHMTIANNPKTIDDILSGEVLGRLSKQPNPS